MIIKQSENTANISDQEQVFEEDDEKRDQEPQLGDLPEEFADAISTKSRASSNENIHQEDNLESNSVNHHSTDDIEAACKCLLFKLIPF